MTYSFTDKKLEGFTLIEILVVVALIAILAGITIIAINPAQNFEDTRNAQRSSDVNTILNAVTQYTAEDGNSLDDFAIAPATEIAQCPTVDNIGTDSANVDLSDLIPDFIVAVPTDPSTGDDADTGYTICETAAGRIEVTAPATEGDGDDISVTR
ncbi:MAG: type II secretion system protein [Candidatus Dojkabacteria bacterium]